MQNITILPGELSFEDIMQIKEKISKKSASLKDILINEYPEKKVTIRYIKDKLGCSYDYSGIDFWESQAVIHNNQDPRGHTMEFSMYYRLTEKPTTFTEILKLSEYDQKKIFQHLEEILVEMKFDDTEKNINADSVIKTSDDQYIKPPVSKDEYKEALNNLPREKLIKRLMESGISYEDAVEFADDVDKDREEFNDNDDGKEKK